MQLNNLATRLFALLANKQRLGTFSLYVFALSAWLNPILNHVAFGIMTLLVISDTHARRWVIDHPLSRFIALFCVYVSMISIKGMIEFIETWPYQLLQTAKWLLLSGVIVIAYWMQASPRIIDRCLLLGLAGFLLGLLTHSSLSSVFHFEIGWQPHFQFSRAGMAGLASAVCLVGLISFAASFVDLKRPSWERISFWLVAVYLTSFVLVASQSRISWLALIAGLLGSQFLHVPNRASKSHTTGIGTKWALGLLIALTLGAGAFMNAGVMRERMANDVSTLEALWQGQAIESPNASFSIRYRIARFGWEQWRQRPILGWGNVGSATLAQLTDDPRNMSPEPDDGHMTWFPHLHSTYLEILVRYGAAGLLMFGAGAAYWLLSARRVCRHGWLSGTNCRFMLASFVLMLVWCLAGYRATMEEWRALFLIISGMAFTFRTPAPGTSLTMPG